MYGTKDANPLKSRRQNAIVSLVKVHLSGTQGTPGTHSSIRVSTSPSKSVRATTISNTTATPCLMAAAKAPGVLRLSTRRKVRYCEVEMSGSTAAAVSGSLVIAVEAIQYEYVPGKSMTAWSLHQCTSRYSFKYGTLHVTWTVVSAPSGYRKARKEHSPVVTSPGKLPSTIEVHRTDSGCQSATTKHRHRIYFGIWQYLPRWIVRKEHNPPYLLPGRDNRRRFRGKHQAPRASQTRGVMPGYICFQPNAPGTFQGITSSTGGTDHRSLWNSCLDN
ncbi:hypothetical protein F4780DRAFT_364782 [Xylariomycetidae sp. FL0641]|nr:hypothetical protein F4780DRAFT_364782 [Xylariomycetidae sp. FL0641]